jgi:hypothetical protein
MARNSNSKRMKNAIQNVRVVDKDEGIDDVRVDRILQQLNQSESQIRVSCNVRAEISPGTTVGTSSITSFGYNTCANSDDFVSLSAQYTEFRIRAMRFDVYDVQPNASVLNYMGTSHTQDATPTTLENILDRNDSRSLTSGQGKTSLSWLAHAIPEMEFQSCTSFVNLGSFNLYVNPQVAVSGAKYQVVCKFIVDFRGRL